MSQPNHTPPSNQPSSGQNPQNKKSKFNIYWIYGIIFLLIISYNLFRGVESSGIEIYETNFKELLKQGDVTKYKIIGNKKIVQVY
ncbi:MAG: hypothetical protein FGM46_08980, partial [Ferruginibacter sp.]|nr:hypothetical protein [Ferruginibacter sp.]